MKSIKNIIFIVVSLVLTCCNGETNRNADNNAHVTTPVTVISAIKRPISEIISFKAISAYQKKNLVKANVNGYLEKTFITIGDFVTQGKPLFTAKTKEAKALGGLNEKDSPFTFNGEMTINAPSSGVVTEVTKQLNDYINDGDQLCVIAEQSSFVFLLNVPFEQNRYATIGKDCQILLPDSTMIKGTITSKLSTIDLVSQTQSYVVKPSIKSILPENLSAIVQIAKSTKPNAQVINKSCVLADETMENFWVMKLINDSTAIKTPVDKGIAVDSMLEILTPQFNLNDRIIKTGNYGLPDTAYVKIIKP